MCPIHSHIFSIILGTENDFNIQYIMKYRLKTETNSTRHLIAKNISTYLAHRAELSAIEDTN